MGGFVGAVKYFLLLAFAFVEDNAIMVGATLCIGILPLLLFCCGGDRKKAKASTTKAVTDTLETAAEASSSSAQEQELACDTDQQDGEPKEQAPKKGTAKKRTP